MFAATPDSAKGNPMQQTAEPSVIVKAGPIIAILLSDLAGLLASYPLISFILMAGFGSLAAHLLDVERGASTPKDFKTFAARFFVTEFTCVLLWFLWDYSGWPIALGLVTCGIVSVWPKQILEYSREALKRIADGIISSKSWK